MSERRSQVSLAKSGPVHYFYSKLFPEFVLKEYIVGIRLVMSIIDDTDRIIELCRIKCGIVLLRSVFLNAIFECIRRVWRPYCPL